MKKREDKMKKTEALIIVGLIGIVMLAVFANAWGVDAPYWEDPDGNPLNMAPGETKDIQLGLQNMVGNENITVRASLVKGENIATLIDENKDYSIPFRTKDVKVNIRIKVPEDAQLNQTYRIGVSFITVQENQPGTFAFGSSIEKYFPVVVKEKAKIQEAKGSIFSKPGFYVIVIAIIVLIALIIAGMRKKEAP